MLRLAESVLARGFGSGTAVGLGLGTEAVGVGCGVEVAGLLVLVVLVLLALAVEVVDVVGAALGRGGEGFVGVLELVGGVSIGMDVME